MILQELRDRQSVRRVLRHAQMQAFQAHIQQDRVLRRLDRAEIAHEL